MSAPDVSGRWWVKLTLSALLLFCLFQWSASALHSDRGQAGIVVCGLVVLACWLVQRLLWRRPKAAVPAALGLGRPDRRGLARGAWISVLLLLVIPGYRYITGAEAGLRPGWLWLLPGLFAQAGIAEEVLFRGYLFGAVRQHYEFRRAAMLSAIPFVIAHLLLFVGMAWPLALASTGLALISSFPLARLYELGGRTIWPPALLHFVIQGALKVIEVPGDPGMGLTAAWFVAAALLPWLAFVPLRHGGGVRAASL